MKTGKTLVELANEIERQRSAKKDLVATTNAITAIADADAPGHVAFQVQNGDLVTFKANDLAVVQAAERSQIPVKYVRRMQAEAPQLLASNLNHWFHDKPERRMIRTLDGRARAFLSDRYQRIDNTDVANATLTVFGDFPGLEVRSTEITENRLYIKATLPSLTREIKSRRVGDLVEAGVMISNSEVGLGAVTVTPFALFLYCLNGMTRDGVKRWNHVGSKISGEETQYLSDDTLKAADRVDLMVIRDTLRHALGAVSFDGWIERIQQTTQQRITGDVPAVVEMLAERLILADSERKTVLQHLIEGGDLSRYGLMNAVTATANTMENYDRATELEMLGQRVIDLPQSEWRQIAEAA